MSPVATARRAWTHRDLVALPEDQLRHELIDGDHFVSPPPTAVHQSILLNLVRLLLPYLDRSGLGRMLVAPFDVKLSLFTVVVPDLVCFAANRFARVVDEKPATAAPDLVVEILSPGTRRRGKGLKRAVCDREGVQEYWTVDPDARSITALRRPRAGAGLTDAITATAAGGDVLESPLFPGLQVPLRDVFRGR